jgi:D-alanyl-lipoteichoic acid acyltransferase DltB (MBOAT superfamily)
MSYVIDVYRGSMPPIRGLSDYALYVAYFPQLVAGPIERATNLAPQILHPRMRPLTAEQYGSAAWLIAWGLFKKVFVADNLAPWVDQVFTGSGAVSGPEALFGVYAFALQIYGDFAGYSDIARGVSRLMGIELMLNFRAPYFVTNPADFWQHWHISLSTWLRDYLYIPLGGNRGGTRLTYRNLLLTMLLGGLWHGAAWTFVLWGAYQGLLLVAYRALRPFLQQHALSPLHPLRPLWTCVKMLGMFHLTCLGWLIFRARSVGQAAGMLDAVFHRFTMTPEAFLLLKALLFYAGWFGVLWLLSQLARLVRIPAVRVPVAGALAGCLAYLLVFHRVATRAFIYFQF